jgi:hypothetical protein
MTGVMSIGVASDYFPLTEFPLIEGRRIRRRMSLICRKVIVVCRAESLTARLSFDRSPFSRWCRNLGRTHHLLRSTRRIAGTAISPSGALKPWTRVALMFLRWPHSMMTSFWRMTSLLCARCHTPCTDADALR